MNQSFNHQLLTRAGGLWVEACATALDPACILSTQRVGIDYARAEWAEVPWRFVWKP